MQPSALRIFLATAAKTSRVTPVVCTTALLRVSAGSSDGTKRTPVRQPHDVATNSRVVK